MRGTARDGILHPAAFAISHMARTLANLILLLNVVRIHQVFQDGLLESLGFWNTLRGLMHGHPKIPSHPPAHCKEAGFRPMSLSLLSPPLGARGVYLLCFSSVPSFPAGTWAERFSLHKTTGELRTTTKLRQSDRGEYVFTVTATDRGINPRSMATAVRIQVGACDAPLETECGSPCLSSACPVHSDAPCWPTPTPTAILPHH